MNLKKIVSAHGKVHAGGVLPGPGQSRNLKHTL